MLFLIVLGVIAIFIVKVGLFLHYSYAFVCVGVLGLLVKCMPKHDILKLELCLQGYTQMYRSVDTTGIAFYLIVIVLFTETCGDESVIYAIM